MSTQRCYSHLSSRGFTLVELITVLVILGVVAAIGSQFLVSTIDSYNLVQSRSKLINRGRVVMEQMSRRLRSALPNSLRVSASGNCVEFLPLATAVSYLSEVPDENNLAALVASIDTEPYSLVVKEANHVSIGALDVSEIYSFGSPNSRVEFGSLGRNFLGVRARLGKIPLGSDHRFNRNSVARRAYVAADPRRFCLSGKTLYAYSHYGLLSAPLNDLDPGGKGVVMAENVNTNGYVFLVKQGAREINTVLSIHLNFFDSHNHVSLRRRILVRNVP